MHSPSTRPSSRAVPVAPRYLAGPGTGPRPGPAFDHLLASGWRLDTALHTGNSVATSPCHRLRVGYGSTPHSPHPWQIGATRDVFGVPEWRASFGVDTPPEILTAFFNSANRFLDALGIDDDDQLFRPEPADLATTVAPLTEAGWRTHRMPWDITRFTSPNAQAVLHWREGFTSNHLTEMSAGQTLWWLEVAPQQRHAAWDAYLTFRTPHQLVSDLLQAVVAPEPLMRDPRILPQHLVDRLGAAQQRSAARDTASPSDGAAASGAAHEPAARPIAPGRRGPR